MKKNKIYTLLFFCGCLFFASTKSIAQGIFEFDTVELEDLNEESKRHYNRYLNKYTVDHVELIRVKTDQLKNSRLQFKMETGKSYDIRVSEFKRGYNETESRFAKLPDESSIFITRKNKQIISKFYDEKNAISVLPLQDDIHMLIRFNNGIYDAECGNQGLEESTDPIANINRFARNDDDCKVRIMVCYTDDAVDVIPGDLDLHAEAAIDETNTAFIDSDADLRFELAAIRVFTVIEDLNVNASGRSTELDQFFTNAGAYHQVNTFRDRYKADMNIIILSDNMISSTGGTLFGQVVAVGVNAANAYAVATVPSISDGRFTFTHELGHIMGARHENHGTNYNRGMVIEPAGTANRLRTIMATTGADACGLATSCRVQHFSNPGINFGANATGVINTFDNARWLDENANDIRNYEETDDHLILIDETLQNNSLANYAANNTINSDNKSVICNADGILRMRAGDYITLKPGVLVNQGAFASFSIGDCNADYPERGDETFVSNEAQEKIHAVDKIELRIDPNPMFDQAIIQFSLEEKESVILVLSDINGREIKRLLRQEVFDPGKHNLNFMNTQFPPGIYYLTLKTKSQTQTKKLIISR